MSRPIVADEDAPRGNNDQGTKKRFLESEQYEKMIPVGQETYGPNMANLRDPLRVLYGKVDFHGYAVKPKLHYLKEIRTPESEGRTYMALDFVADLFNEMVEYVSISKNKEILNKKSIYEDFFPKKAWADLESIYGNFLEIATREILVGLPANPHAERNIRSYLDFEKYFISRAVEYAYNRPFTKTEFAVSNASDRFHTGLVVDVVEDANCARDEEKWRGFFMDVDFANVKQIANRFGFRIDYNAPWRFHCDLNSPVVQERLILRGVTSFVDFFDRFYEKIHVGYIDELKKTLIETYNAYISYYPTYEKLEICNGKPVTKVYERMPAEPYAVDKLSRSHWYGVYAKIRVAERRMKVDPHQMKRLLKQAQDYDLFHGGSRGEDIIENYFIDRTADLGKDDLTNQRIFDKIISEKLIDYY